MKIDKVSKELDQVFDKLLCLFDSDEIKQSLKKKAYFAGGCIYCLANDKKVNDYDIFLDDNELIEKLKNLPLWKCKTEYALSYGKYQIVTKYFGDPLSCVGQFDFKHNMFFYRPYSGNVGKACYSFKILHTDTLLFNKKRARDIEGVYLRIQKFRDRGFIVPKELEKSILKRTTATKIKKYKRDKYKNRNFY